MAVTLRSVKGSALTQAEVDANFWSYPQIIASSGAAITNTGNTTENTLATVVIPGGALGPNGYLRVTSLWTTTGNTNTKTCRVRFNGTAFHDMTHTTATQLQMHLQTLIQNRNSASSQVGASSAGAAYSVGANGTIVTSAHDTTGDLNLIFTAQCVTSGSDSIILERYIVELGYGA